MQIITAQEIKNIGIRASQERVHVDRLHQDDVRHLLVDAYPDSRVRELEAAERLTKGHPYLVQLLIGAASNLDLQTVLDSISSGADIDPLAAEALGNISIKALFFLKIVTWMGIPFTTAQARAIDGSHDVIVELASRYLLIRVGADRYRVHDIISGLVKRKITPEEALELHQHSALFLMGLEHPSWLEIRTMLVHARAASMSDIIKHAGTELLQFAFDRGLWPLAYEAAESLVNDPTGSEDWFPHFVLGKCRRMRDERKAAISDFENAEIVAIEKRAQELARYERASVLHEMGETQAAESLFKDLSTSDDVAIQISSKLAIGYGLGQRGDITSAISVLQEAAEMAKLDGKAHEEAEVWQGMGSILADAERWNEARDCLMRASTIRSSLTGAKARDIYGWYHLYRRAFEVECALENHHGAADAARCLWSCSLMSGNIDWQSSSAIAMCTSYEDKTSPDLDKVVEALHVIGYDVDSPPRERVSALNGIVQCQWLRCDYLSAMDAVLSIVALADDLGVDAPVIGHLEHSDDFNSTILPLFPVGYVLVLPPGETQEFITKTVSTLLQRRPELAQYAVLRKLANIKAEHLPDRS